MTQPANRVQELVVNLVLVFLICLFVFFVFLFFFLVFVFPTTIQTIQEFEIKIKSKGFTIIHN